MSRYRLMDGFIFSPLVLMVLILVVVQPISIATGNFLLLRCFNIFGFLWLVSLVVYIIRRVKKNNQLSSTDKTMWITTLIFFNYFMVLYYWYKYIRHKFEDNK